MHRHCTVFLHGLLATAVTACANGPRDRVRFANEAIVWRVDDRRDVPEKPAVRRFDHVAYVFHNTAHRPIDDLLAMRAPRRATNVNSLGEVPDSTWFTNRIGKGKLSLEEMRRGPNRDDGPEPGEPLRVLQTKAGGASPGFLVEDRRGVRYVMKFDRPSRPEMETGADVVVQRLLWAVGYNVPENFVIHVRRDDLQVDPSAVKKLGTGDEVALTAEDVDEVLSSVYSTSRGEYRALVSRFIAGEPIGGSPQFGRRRDDPNDLVRHELMRELRGLYVFAAWIAHSDMKEDNTLDAWVEDETRGRHYVVHYLLDFGKALGVMAWTNAELHDGYVRNFDYGQTFLSLATLGLWDRPWEARREPGIRGVGVFESESFRPHRFRSRNRFVPFIHMDPFDAFWATKILMRFTPELIRTAVEQGRYTDPTAVHYLTRVLVERQRITGRHWFGVVNPLDEFEVHAVDTAYRVCARDLLLAYDLDPEAVTETSYMLLAHDRAGSPTGWRRSAIGRGDGRLCADGLRPSRDAQGYTIVGFTTRRGKKSHDPVYLHLALDPTTHRLRIIGLDRS